MKKSLLRNALIFLASLSISHNAAADISAETAAAASQEWHSYLDPLGPLGDRMVARMANPDDAQLRHELYRGIFSETAAAYLALLYADPQHPDFWPWLSTAFNHVGPNPDDDYYLTPIDDDGIYKITGFRGTVKRVDFQLSAGQFIPRGKVDQYKFGTTLANYDLDSIPLKKDGSFEVILSATRPERYKGNWWPLPPKSESLFVRQISYDWLHEVDGRFAIQRLDRPAVKPRPSTAELAENLKQIPVWVEAYLKLSFDLVQGFRKQGWINKLGYKDLSEVGGIVTQRYAYGAFDLQPDEALIVEAQVPKQCRYWSIQLTDDLFLSIDWMNRQTNLNGYTARVDKDGVFRAVISAQDPGVPNWLDTAGYASGVIQVRWEKCSNWPEHKVTKVKTAEVRQYLPAETPLVSLDARDQAIRLRRTGAQMRKRW